jgi:hypothetical protein
METSMTDQDSELGRTGYTQNVKGTALHETFSNTLLTIGSVWRLIRFVRALFRGLRGLLQVVLNLLCQTVVGVAEMPLHRLFRRPWVPGGKGFNDRLVLGNRLTPRGRVFKVLSELEAQRGMTRVEEFCHDTNQYAIASLFGDVEMKCSVCGKVGSVRMQVGIQGFKDPF